MDTYHKTEDRPLEPKELRKLKRGFWVIPIFLLIIIAFFYFLFSEIKPAEGFFFWVPVGFAVFFGGLMGYIIWGFAMDLSQGTKQVFQGLITGKDCKRKAGKNASTSYFLLFGEKRMRVELYLYNRFEVGDLVEIHRSKRLYNMIYKTELLQRDATMAPVAENKQAKLRIRERIGFAVVILFVLLVGGLVAGVHLGFIEW